jgi:hypothetical protein
VKNKIICDVLVKRGLFVVGGPIGGRRGGEIL